MKRIFFGLMMLLNFVVIGAQQDTIYISAKINSAKNQISVNQEITYYNTTDSALSQIKLLNWIAAYQNRNTPLVKRKLEDRKSDLFFAKPAEIGSLENLTLKIGDQIISGIDTKSENLYIPLSSNLNPGEKVQISLHYVLNLPDQKFTGYGFDGEKYALKYFFLVPDRFEDSPQSPKNFIDIEENQSPGIHWKVILDVPSNYYSESNLPQTHLNYFEGNLNNDPEFSIADHSFDTISTLVDGKKTAIVFGYALTEKEKQNLEFYLPLQLNFIKNKTGTLPEKIFISEKFRKNENFTGIEDIKFWKFRFALFNESQITDLKYFSIISKKVMQQSAIFEKNEDHWLENGLKTYLEIQYLERYYQDEKLLGQLPDHAKILGLKPLKIFHASKLKLLERYGLAYQYILTQNLDQKIATPFKDLSNYNANAISYFETGSLFSFISEKMGREKFEDFLSGFLRKNAHQRIDKKAFLDELSLASGYSSDFLEDFLQRKNRVNFNLKRFTKSEDSYELKIAKNTARKIPFKIETESKSGNKKEFWFDTGDSKENITYKIPQSDADKIVINGEYIFPEKNFRDNYLYTKGVFSNMKKIRLKVFRDIPNPEFNEIYVNPRLSFNAYDKILFGLNFKNSSFFDRKFDYSVTPYYSSGTGKLTGSGGVSYSFQPAESFFNTLEIGISGSYFHYDYDLTYRKVGVYANMNFTKSPRSDIGRNFGVSYSFFDKDLDPKRKLVNDYQKYNLYSVGYGYSDRRMIHEKYIGANLQFMDDFQKLSAEASYRWEYAKNKKLSLRFFGGYFITNNTKNNLFNYGIARVSNYSFSYGLLGQSATTGLLSQQFILAEGGFKSFIGSSVNQWITSVNLDSHVWRMFNFYADAGVYKNKNREAQFVWDSGVKLKVIPDFLEIYFPLQSSLGFEPSFKDYGRRIRFTLSLNFSAITSYFRRGYY